MYGLFRLQKSQVRGVRPAISVRLLSSCRYRRTSDDNEQDKEPGLLQLRIHRRIRRRILLLQLHPCSFPFSSLICSTRYCMLMVYVYGRAFVQ